MKLSLDWATQRVQSQAFVGEDSLMEYALTPVDAMSGVHWVLAPHADDEVFGLGGVMALLSAANNPVHVGVLTQGAARAEQGLEAQKAAIRQAESIRAGGVLGVSNYVFHPFADRRLCGELGALIVLTKGLAEIRPSHVYVTSPWEVHPDHRALAQAVMFLWVESWFQAQANLQVQINPSLALQALPDWDLCFYEVGAALWPNTLIDITSVVDKKFAAMQCFDSELQFQRYDRYVQALNTYRAYPTGGEAKGSSVAQVEALFSVKKLVAGPWFQSRLAQLFDKVKLDSAGMPSRDDLLKLLQVGLIAHSGQVGMDLRELA
jgi:LmbE family N-acetylglucosaminyl deacetylase